MAGDVAAGLVIGGTYASVSLALGTYRVVGLSKTTETPALLGLGPGLFPTLDRSPHVANQGSREMR